MHWLEKYSQMKHFNRNPLYQNHIIYDFEHDKNAMAKSIIDYFNDEDNKNMIDRLKKYGINMDYTSGEEVIADENFNGKTFVLTGTLNQITRDKASEIIENKGGKVTSSVTKKTSVVVVGDNPGSKYDKAVSLNIEIWNEEKFMDLISDSF